MKTFLRHWSVKLPLPAKIMKQNWCSAPEIEHLKSLRVEYYEAHHLTLLRSVKTHTKISLVQ